MCSTKRPDGTYAGANAPCSLNGECFGKKGCQEYLLKPRGGTVRVHGDVKKAYRYNIGTYYIKYGNAGDTCFWESRTCTERADGSFKVDCTPYQKDNSNLGVPGDPCVRVLKIVDTAAPQVQPTFNQNNMPETYNPLTDSSRCNPPTDAAKEDVACYDFFGLLGPYAPGYTVNPLDKWGGVEPEFGKANCCGPNKDKPFYDVEPDDRKKTVIHEGATKFQDPGVQIFDVVDGIMVYEESNICKRIDNPKAGQEGEPECSVVGDPGKVCKVIAGGTKGKCTDPSDFDLDRTGKQQILYYAMDSSDNLNFLLRTVEINDSTPPTIKLYTDTRLKLDLLYEDFITCKGTGCRATYDFTNKTSKYSIMLNNLERPQTLRPGICRCSPDVEAEKTADRNLNKEAERISTKCPTEVTSRTELLTDCANGVWDKAGKCVSQVYWKPSGPTCTNPDNKKENECYEPRQRCETLVTAAGIKYLDPGAEAMDAVKPKELEMNPKRVNNDRTIFDPQDADHTEQTLRVHNSVNVYPHKGPIPVVYEVTYMAKDAAGNEAEISRQVTIEDLIAPKLQPLDEKDEVEVEGGARFDDAFAIAEDGLDGDLTWDISLQVARTNNLVRRQECCQEIDRSGGGAGTCIPKVTGCDSDTRSVETRAPAGTIFKFTYSVKDRGNPSAAKAALRQVKIVDTTPPVIEVDIPGGQWQVERGGDWDLEREKILKQVTASDNIDDHPWITERVQISDCVGEWPDGTPKCVDTNQPAFTKFLVEFRCDDFVGNSAKLVELQIIIVDSDQPTIKIDNGVTRNDPLELQAMEVPLSATINDDVTASDKADTPNGKYPYLSTEKNPLRHASRVRALVVEKKLVECQDGEYLAASLKPVDCLVLSTCLPDEHESKAPTKTSDRVCTTNTQCLDSRLEIKEPTSNSDRVCCACKTCGTKGERDLLVEKWAGALEFVDKCRPALPGLDQSQPSDALDKACRTQDNDVQTSDSNVVCTFLHPSDSRGLVVGSRLPA